MLIYILYFPLLAALLVMLAFTLSATSGALRYNARKWPVAGTATVAIIALIAASLTLMFAVHTPWAQWAAVGLLAAVALPVLGPITLLLGALGIAKLSGKPIRWN